MHRILIFTTDSHISGSRTKIFSYLNTQMHWLRIK